MKPDSRGRKRLTNLQHDAARAGVEVQQPEGQRRAFVQRTSREHAPVLVAVLGVVALVVRLDVEVEAREVVRDD